MRFVPATPTPIIRHPFVHNPLPSPTPTISFTPIPDSTGLRNELRTFIRDEFSTLKRDMLVQQQVLHKNSSSNNSQARMAPPTPNKLVRVQQVEIIENNNGGMPSAVPAAATTTTTTTTFRKQASSVTTIPLHHLPRTPITTLALPNNDASASPKIVPIEKVNLFIQSKPHKPTLPGKNIPVSNSAFVHPSRHARSSTQQQKLLSSPPDQFMAQRNNTVMHVVHNQQQRPDSANVLMQKGQSVPKKQQSNHVMYSTTPIFSEEAAGFNQYYHQTPTPVQHQPQNGLVGSVAPLKIAHQQHVSALNTSNNNSSLEKNKVQRQLEAILNRATFVPTREKITQSTRNNAVISVDDDDEDDNVEEDAVSVEEEETAFVEQEKRPYNVVEDEEEADNSAEEIAMDMWDKEEMRIFEEYYKKYGKKWHLIAKHLPSKTAQQVADFFKQRALTPCMFKSTRLTIVMFYR